MPSQVELLSALIQKQIQKYQSKLEINEEGNVIAIGDGIALIYGLNNAMYGELLDFPNAKGMVLSLEENLVGAVLLTNADSIKEGDWVRRTKKMLDVQVGDEFLGRVVDALGQPIDMKGKITATKMRPIERVAPGVITRASVNAPLETGILFIDALIPIGKGQRELIIGDRQTGKTTIALDSIINQKGKNVLCVYVAIGQKNSTIAQIVKKLTAHNAMEYTVVVCANASELAPLQYIAPYTATAIAEEWMENGKDVLIIYDDLSKHAVAYRTFSLLLRRPPGREAYPGDIFYIHSRLLERAGKLNAENGGGSITALPIIETQAGDISAYIPTNVISITDGQIFLLTDLFNAGQRPAISSGLSVSRVGSAAQINTIKTLASSLKLELAQFRELEAFAQFGSDLDANTKLILDHGQKIIEVLKQPQFQPLPQEDQAIILFSVKTRLIRFIPNHLILNFKENLIHFFHLKHPDVCHKLKTDKKLDVVLNKALEQISVEFIYLFVLNIEQYDAKLLAELTELKAKVSPDVISSPVDTTNG